MQTHITIGQAAAELRLPIHQVRRTADRLWPSLPRAGKYRLISRDRLAELTAAVVERYGAPSAPGAAS